MSHLESYDKGDEMLQLKVSTEQVDFAQHFLRRRRRGDNSPDPNSVSIICRMGDRLKGKSNSIKKYTRLEEEQKK